MVHYQTAALESQAAGTWTQASLTVMVEHVGAALASKGSYPIMAVAYQVLLLEVIKVA